MTEFYDPTHSGPSSLRSRLAAIYGSVTRALRRIPLHSWFRTARDTLKTLFRRLWTLVKRALSRATRLIVKVWRRAILASVQIWQWMKTLWGAVRLSPAMQGVFLAGFAMAAAGLLAGANETTAEAIAERQAEDLRYSLSLVVPDKVHDNNLADDLATVTDTVEGELAIYRARRGATVTAAAFELTGYGYGGAIKILFGLDAEGRLLGVRVLSHSETPGLGDKIEEKKSAWILGFDGLSLGNPPADRWTVKKDGGQFDQFAGATISPRAVVATIKRGLEFFARNKIKILSPERAKKETG